MPRNGQGVYSLPPNTAAVAGQTIESAPYNTVNNDIANDLNAARPITAGGTGATNAAAALDNLGGVGQSNFLSAYAIGDTYITLRNIAAVDGVWLKRDGSLYDSADYPELAALSDALPDGVEWSTVTTGVTGSISAFLALSEGFYIGTKDVSSSNIYFSPDLNGFSLRATIPSFSIEGLVSGGGIIGAIDGNGKVSASNNGITFSAPISVNANGFGPGAVAWSGTVFTAAGGNGTIYTSPDFSSWTLRTSGTTQFLYSVNYVNNTFIITGGNGVILTAPAAGTPWTARTSGVTNILYDSTFGSGVYVVTGSGGTILSSTNLTAWTPRSSGTTSDLNSVTYSTAGFLAVGGVGTARISSAGTSWAVSATGTSASLKEASYDPDAQNIYFASSSSSLLRGLRTLPTQFRVPNGPSTDAWIKAENAA